MDTHHDVSTRNQQRYKSLYPVNVYSLLLNMAIEIVDLPMIAMVIFHVVKS